MTTKDVRLERQRRIIRTSLLGIAANALLAAVKAAVGLATRSIAVVMDAVNNLTDALSSVITIIGARLAERAPDREHPYGHGRVEYIAATLISALVLYAGLTSLLESGRKILHPATPEYSPLSLVMIALAVAVKLVLGRHVKRVGEQVRSGSLVNSGEDARMDALISASTLAAAAVFLLSGLSLEAWLGAAISLVIIHSGVKMLRETISRVLGERAATKDTQALRQTIAEAEGVMGVYDLIVHDYGPDHLMASVHVEVPEDWTAKKIDLLSRDIQQRVYQRHGVVLTAVGVYARNTGDNAAARLRDELCRRVLTRDYVLQLHGFHMDEAAREVRFDVVVDYVAPDRDAVYRGVLEDVAAVLPGYRAMITMDNDSAD